MITFKDYITEISKPAGNYVSLNVDGSVYLVSNDLVSTGTKVTPDKQHVTLMYSEWSSLDHGEVLQIIESEFPVAIVAQGVEFECFDSDKENTSCIVLKLKSDILNAIHTRLIALGCNHSYSEFKPHITLWYDVDKEEARLACRLLNKIEKLPIDVRLAGYKSEPIDDNWSKKLDK